MNKSEISVKNNGNGIPTLYNEEIKMYIPEQIFGVLMSGTNYDDSEEKIVGGQNGLGAKLTNIFAKKFTVKTVYKDTYYEQTFENNMSVVNKPLIK